MKKFEQWQDMIARLYPELKGSDNASGSASYLSRTVTFQVTDACSLACTYCYQINKGTRRMRFETAKKLIDMLLDGDERLGGYVDVSTSPGIIIEFIGGEPFLEVKLIEQICDYFTERAIELCHPWATMHMFSICSNGVAYFDEDVQHFLNKYGSRLSFSVTIDGNKELHDSCRVFPDGKTGSYDLAVAAAQDWIKRGGYMGSKITIAPGNLKYLYDAITHMIDLGYDEINANVVYEKGWEIEHAKEYYKQLKRIADYWIEHDIVETHYLALFNKDFFHPKEEDDLQNWCWGADTPILTTKGYIPIQDIIPGDLVYTEDGTIHPVIDIKSHFANNVVKIKGCGFFDMVCTDDHKLFAEHNKHYGKYQVKELKFEDKIKLGVLPERTISYNKEIAFLIGKYLGDSFDTIMYPKDSEKNTEFERMLGNCRDSSLNKHIPSECFLWDNDSLKALIDGYLANNDFRFMVEKTGNCTFTVANKYLANEIMLIMRSLGQYTTCDCFKSDNIEVYSSLYKETDHYTLWATDLLYKKTKSQMVYNITVDTNHSYIAGGLVSSNCGGNGVMLSMDPDGYLYPCIRYMESSLGDDREPYRIGHVDEGIGQTECTHNCIECLNKVDRRTQSTDKCFYCPIAEGCSWCTAYNYQVNGTPDSRCTYICDMHKARALANAYMWNTWYRKNNSNERFKIHVPEEWALEIIDRDEYEMLLKLSENDSDKKEG